MGAPRPMAWYSNSSRRASAIEEGERVKQHDAEGVVPRRTREGTPTAWPNVRVKPAEKCQCGPRASTRPRWPVDAKSPLKNANVFINPHRCCCGEVGGGLVRRRLRHVLGHRCPVYEGAGRG